jgi:hypothetical protein
VGGLPHTDNGSFLSDPIVIYDEVIGRFIVGDQDVDFSTNKGSFDFAVSTTSNPATLSAADWKFYQVGTNEPGFVADYPGNFGYNHDAFVYTLNMFGSTSNNVLVTSVPQSALAVGVPNTKLVANLNIYNGFSVRPVTMHNSAAGDPMWFVTEGGDSQSVNVVKMTNVLSNTAVFTPTNVPVNPYTPIVQFGSVLPLNPDGFAVTGNIDSRIIKAAEFNNTIVAAHSVVASPTEIDIHWYKIDVSTGTPMLTDQGDVNAGDNTYLVYPAIDINSHGDIGMTYSRSGTDSTTDYISMWLTGRLATDQAGTMQTPVEVPAGTGTVNDDFDGREGDLSGINLDPVDGSFWASAEYATPSTNFGVGSWGTAIANFTVSAAGEHFELTSDVSTAVAGTPFRLTVQAIKPDGTPDTGYTGTVHFASTDPLAVLPPDSKLTNGVYTFTVTLKTVTKMDNGKQTITATDVNTNSIAGRLEIPVVAGAAYQLAFVQQPTDTSPGIAISPPVTVELLDQYGNLSSNDNTDKVTMTIGTNPGGGTLSGTNPVTAVNGIATFSNLSINNPGTGYTLVATDSSLNQPTVTSNSFTITAPAGVIEDFERPNALALYTTVNPPVTVMVDTAAAHDGNFGLDFSNSNGWIYRNDAGVQIGQNETISVWVKFNTAADGRAYFGFGASSGGTLSAVLAPNTGQLIIQQNLGYGFQDLASVSQQYQPNKWYKVQIGWANGGLITLKLFDSNGTSLLNTVRFTTNVITAGGIAFRATGHNKYFDTVSVTPGVSAPTRAGSSVVGGGGLSPAEAALASGQLAGGTPAAAFPAPQGSTPGGAGAKPPALAMAAALHPPRQNAQSVLLSGGGNQPSADAALSADALANFWEDPTLPAGKRSQLM